jgi:hypothetical protein
MTKGEPVHRWPEEEAVRKPAPPKSGRLARLGRVLGDTFLTAGLARGMTGRAGAPADRAAVNVMLFGVGDALGREANRTSDEP